MLIQVHEVGIKILQNWAYVQKDKINDLISSSPLVLALGLVSPSSHIIVLLQSGPKPASYLTLCQLRRSQLARCLCQASVFRFVSFQSFWLLVAVIRT